MRGERVLAGSAQPSGRRRSRWSSIDRLTWLSCIGTALVLTVASVMRHRNHWSGAFDLGVFDQGVWLLSRAVSPEVTVNGRNLFADHFSPVLLGFVPLYRLWADPFWFFAAQGVALGATVFPLRALARQEGVPAWLPIVLVPLGAPLASAALFDFHPSTLAVPFVAQALVAARRGDPRSATVAAIAILVCRAELAWLLLGIALLATPAVRRRFVGLAATGLVLGFAIPVALGARGTFSFHYGHLGQSPVDALLQPWATVAHLVSASTALKLLIWTMPAGALAVFKPRWLLAVVVAGLPMLLSNYRGLQLPWNHYSAPLFPIAVGGTFATLAELRRRRGPTMAPRMVAAVALASLFVIGPLVPFSAPTTVFTVNRSADIDTLRPLLSPSEPVAASNEVLAQLTHRGQAWIFPSPFVAGRIPELYPTPSATSAAMIDAVIVSTPADKERVVRLGFVPVAGHDRPDAETTTTPVLYRRR